MTPEETPFEREISEKSKNYPQGVSTDFKALNDQFFSRELKDTDIKDHCLKQGQPMPHFQLLDIHNQPVTSQALLSKQWLILVFYRGAWCPFCNIYLKHLQNRLSAFNQVPARLVAISPQTPDSTQEVIQKNQLTFDVLSDVGSEVAKQFGLVFTVPEYLNELYQRNGIDFQYFNGSGKIQLPTPATYIIDQQGIIRYAYVEYDYTRRMDPKDVLQFITSQA
ncbi:MAG TPA: alkyl hydroperoxide reductase [Microscillaceae bacterium]|nr:alkyl hydroperoxide reductase [Microscillaceae bacterium]